MPPSQISFDTLCRFFERMVGQRQRKGRKKAGGAGGERDGGFRLKEVHRFIEVVVDKQSHDAFSIFRLMLPSVRGLVLLGEPWESMQACAALCWTDGRLSMAAGSWGYEWAGCNWQPHAAQSRVLIAHPNPRTLVPPLLRPAAGQQARQLPPAGGQAGGGESCTQAGSCSDRARLARGGSHGALLHALHAGCCFCACLLQRCCASPRYARAARHCPGGMLLSIKREQVCIEAAVLEKNSAEAVAVRGWKRPNAKKAGDFAAVLKDVSGLMCSS